MDELTAVREARADVDAANDAIERGIRTAVADGYTYAKVGAAAGVTRQRVFQIIRGAQATTGGLPIAEYRKHHYAVAKLRGTPRLCDECGTSDAKIYDWANMTGNYADPDDYRRLCRGCHAARDAAKRTAQAGV